MSSNKKIVGHVAELHGLVSKPELNGTHVLIDNYFPEKDRYSVHPFITPCEMTNMEQLMIKRSNLKLSCSGIFSDQFPVAEVCRIGTEDTSTGCILGFPPNTILDVSCCGGMDHLALYYSHHLVGAPTALDDVGFAAPKTVIKNGLVVSPYNESSVIEIEDVCFETEIQCISGRNVTFRRCVFHMVYVGHNCDEEERCEHAKGSPKVVFESCTFEAPGLCIQMSAEATLINCLFRSNKQAMSVRGGGKASLKHCTVVGSDYALSVHTGSTMDLLFCSIMNSTRVSVDLVDGGTARLKGCLINHSDIGVMTSGDSMLRMNDCVLQRCDGGGVTFGKGKVDAIITKTYISQCREHALYSVLRSSGNIIINNSYFEGALNQNPTSTCIVIVDGKLRQDGMYGDGPKSSECTLGAAREICYHCSRSQPIGVKYQKCGKCKKVCYCSRECQVAHWKMHKQDCGKTILDKIDWSQIGSML